MTKEQIRAMEAGEELDNSVGVEILRWHKVDTPRRFGWFDRGGYFQAPLQWSPSTDISAAWQVVEKMKDRGMFNRSFRLEYDGSMGTKGLWGCAFSSKGLLAFVRDKTAPEAICKAALLAKLE